MKVVYKYVEDVLADRIPSCYWHRRAVERFVHDLENAHKRGWVFHEGYANNNIDFFPEELRHSKGVWKGKQFILEPWQQFIHANIYGWVHKDPIVIGDPLDLEGKQIERYMRRFRLAYEEVARKNGKTTRLAGIGVYHLYADYEAGPEVYAAATKREQAKRTFSEAANMIRVSPRLSQDLGIAGPLRDPYKIYDVANNGWMLPLGRDSDTEDGLNPSLGIVDEYHAHKTSEMFDVLDSGTASRKQPLMWIITTAGFDSTGPCHDMRDYTTKVLDGFDKSDGIKDDTHFGIIFTADGYDTTKDSNVTPDAWDSPDTWIKANPNMGVTVSLEDLESKARKARSMPRAKNNFETKHVNIWKSSSISWISANKWSACNTEQKTLEDFKGRTCYAGLDLATASNLCSLALLFPDEDGYFDLLVRYYCSASVIAEPDDTGSDLFLAWRDEGHIIETPGEITDYSFIEKDIMHVAETTYLESLGFDRWNSSHLIQRLQNEGMHEQLVGFGQGYRSMNAPILEVERLVKTKKLRVSNNPVMSWQMANVHVRQDPALNTKLDREASKKSIDGPVATVMAVGMYLSEELTEFHDGELSVVSR